MFSTMFSTTSATLVAVLTLPLLTSTQTQAADGAIVPFASTLPACASLCGKLFDVQGACTPPTIASTSSACFCADPRLTAFQQSGTAGVESVCGAASCQDATDLQSIKTWFLSYCSLATTNPTTTASETSPTGTSGSSAPQGTSGKSAHPSWFSTHWKWVVMIIVIAIGLAVIWVGAFLLRRRYLRKKEREIEMRPPVAWGPHQMQGATAGYKYGDAVVDARGESSKEANSEVMATPSSAAGQEKANKGFLKKNRFM